MSKLIQRNAPLLHFLATCNNTKQLKQVVNILDDDQLKAIAECNHNVIKGVVPLSKGHLAKCKLKRKHLLDLDEDDDLDHLKGKTRKTTKEEKNTTKRWRSTNTTCTSARRDYRTPYKGWNRCRRRGWNSSRRVYDKIKTDSKSARETA